MGIKTKEMKREILFRGKSIEPSTEGKWIEGSLLVHGNCSYILPNNPITPFGIVKYRVDPETVGQFTGITDINDIKIFEGDIAKYYNPYSKQWYTHIVKWDKMFASFGFFTQDSEWCKENDWLKIESIEVIGNIHDNKDLLK